MSHPFQLSRYKPAILTIFGAATAYGIYALYTNLSEPPAQTGLHRSNAVHRPRTERPQRATIEYIQPDADAPMGRLVVITISQILKYNLVEEGIPNEDELGFAFGSVPPNQQLQTQLNLAAIGGVLQSALLARTTERRARFTNFGLSELPERIADRNIDEIRTQARNIRSLFTNVSLEEIEQAVNKFLSSEAFLLADSDDDEITFAETEDAA